MDQPKPSAGYRNQSLERGFAILEYLGASTRGQSVSQVAHATGLHRATAHRLLAVLHRLGYVYKGSDQRYWIGFQLHRFGHKPSMIARVTHHAHPFLVSLANEVGETVNLGVLEGTQAFVADRVTTDRSLRLDVQIGDYRDAHATSIGKALLALHRPEDVRRLYERTPLRSYTDTTLKTIGALVRELAVIRRRGYAVNDGEMSPGVRSIAVPLINPEGRALCAVSVTARKSRISDRQIVPIAARIQDTVHNIVEVMAAYPNRAPVHDEQAPPAFTSPK